MNKKDTFEVTKKQSRTSWSRFDQDAAHASMSLRMNDLYCSISMNEGYESAKGRYVGKETMIELPREKALELAHAIIDRMGGEA